MRICLTSDHVYPARIGGIASCRVLDNLAKGLAELGHEVHYCLGAEPVAPLASGVRLADRLLPGADVWHLQDFATQFTLQQARIPWVRSYHSPFPLSSRGPDWLRRNNWIFVSRSHAEANHSRRFVYNGVDPDESIYSESKDNYFLFAVHNLDRAVEKGFRIAVRLKQQCGFRLIVAGGGSRALEERFERECAEIGVEFAGWVDGARKAELFAGAKALLFPTQVPEPFGVVVAEAMMSGTPVIASGHGACRELVTGDVGFICSEDADYLHAVENVRRISPRDCRHRAVSRFHYRVMADGYLEQYLQEISAFQLAI